VILRDRLKKEVAELSDLCTLPATVTRLMEMLGDPDVCIADVVAVVSADQVLASRVLKLANSAFFRRSFPVGTVSDAATYIGLAALRNLTLTVGVMDTLRASESGDFDLSRFWRHSFATALCASRLRALVSTSDIEAYFMAGLLHDVGKVVLANLYPDVVSLALRDGVLESLPFVEAEGRHFEMGHAEVGALLARRWCFPDDLAEVIGNHHGDFFKLSSVGRVVQCADRLAGVYFEREVGPRPELDDKFFEKAGISRLEFEHAHVGELLNNLQTTAVMLGWF